MSKLRAEILASSERVVSRGVAWSQGAGGNVSIKNERWMMIKSSGVRLSDIGNPRGLARIDLWKLRELLQALPAGEAGEAGYGQALKACAEADGEFGPASMESGFHALLPGRHVLHFHSLPAILMAHERIRAPKLFEGWLSARWKREPVAFVGLVRPGWLLTEALAELHDHSVIVLENHGLVVQGNEPALLDDWERLELEFSRTYGYARVEGLLRSPRSRRELESLSTELGACPLKACFPDAVVFADALRGILQRQPQLPAGQPLWEPTRKLWTDSLDLAEVWLALQLLHHECPALREIPTASSRAIREMPLEKDRKLRNGK